MLSIWLFPSIYPNTSGLSLSQTPEFAVANSTGVPKTEHHSLSTKLGWWRCSSHRGQVARLQIEADWDSKWVVAFLKDMVDSSFVIILSQSGMSQYGMTKKEWVILSCPKSTV